MVRAKIAEFHRWLGEWFDATAKDYPWRRTQDAYAILVSEMMLQQTQVATVLEKRYFERWLEAFPTPEVLATAPESDVLRLWEGLGYYNRARYLQKAAQVVVAEYGGNFPEDFALLRALPGLGDYTAGAVATFAFDKKVPIVDANIARVLARLYHFRSPIDDTPGKQFIWEKAAALLPDDQPGRYNAAIMELGQQICVNRQPKCDTCPIWQCCAAFEKEPELLPVKRPRRETDFLTEHAIWCVRPGSQEVLLFQEKGKRRGGFWKLPERTEEEMARSLAPLLYSSKYSITHHRVTLMAYDVAPGGLEPREGETWVPLAKLADLPMASPYRRASQELLRLNLNGHKDTFL